MVPVHLPPAPADHPPQQVHFQIANAQDRLPEYGYAAARQRIDARQQLSKRKGLYQIVIATGAQTPDSVIDLAERAEDQRGNKDALLSKLPQELKAIEPRQHAVDRHDGIAGGARLIPASLAIRREIHPITTRMQAVRYLACRLRVILDDEHAPRFTGHRVPSPPNTPN